MRSVFGLVALLATLSAVGTLATAHSSARTARRTAALPAGAGILTVGRTASGRSIQPGFLGLSFEFDGLLSYMGDDPRAVNPVLEQLVRNLNPGQRPILRIGGDSTDWTWWPVAGKPRPPGVNYSLTAHWLTMTSALSQQLEARVILGLNLEANRPTLASAEARTLIAGIGPSRIAALELGNEPELYGTFTWYTAPGGRKVTGRSAGYDLAAFTHDFSSFAAALPHVALAGPASGDAAWMRELGPFVGTAARLGLVTLHRYPLQLCWIPPSSPQYPTIVHLLSSAATKGLADSVAAAVALAHAHRLPLRVDEMNTIGCGYTPQVARTFASALWALDALFEMARVGIDGVNIHTFPGSASELFQFRRVGGSWRALVEPEYYGLLMFAQAAPPGSRLLSLTGTSAGVQAWGTRGPDGTVRIVLINEDASRARVVAVPERQTVATLERLDAPSLQAGSGVTLGGLSFGSQTETGLLPGTPRTPALKPVGRYYVIRLPAASAAMVTVQAR